MTRLAVNGIRLETRSAGSGPPLLLLHGFTGRGATWASHLPAFRRRHRTIVVDLLGHGRSDGPADPGRHAVECQAADLATLLARLDAIPSDVLGYSMGARIALRLALDHPSAVRRLVLESPSAGIADAGDRAARRASDDALAATIERDGIAAFVDQWEAQPIFASQAAMSPTARRRLRAERLANRPEGLAASLRGAGQGIATPVGGELGRVRVPVLVVAGALDATGLARAKEVVAALPDARLAIVEGAGHAPHIERPAEFRRLVRGFLDAGQARGRRNAHRQTADMKEP
jgi:2-succinyl-6-hydroxy-2,4-cyclohexadiene-1-carboxylate synthase